MVKQINSKPIADYKNFRIYRLICSIVAKIRALLMDIPLYLLLTQKRAKNYKGCIQIYEILGVTI